MSIDGMTDSQLRAEAMAERDLHNPVLQDDNPYQRCALCHYTRHPCSVYDLATTVIELLDRKQKLTEDLTAVIAGGLIAVEHTREYVGEKMLPAIEGWSWFDWSERAKVALARHGVDR